MILSTVTELTEQKNSYLWSHDNHYVRWSSNVLEIIKLCFIVYMALVINIWMIFAFFFSLFCILTTIYFLMRGLLSMCCTKQQISTTMDCCVVLCFFVVVVGILILLLFVLGLDMFY